VALLSLIVTVYADCTTYFAVVTGCLVQSSGPTCWASYVQNQQSQCTVAESVEIFALCKAAIGGCTDCFFTCTPSTCLEALTVFTTCQLSVQNCTTKTVCDCYNNYVQSSAGVCISNDEKLTQWTTCAAAKEGCTNLDCTLDCQLLDSLIPDTRTTFQACWNTSTDKCGCYSAAVDKIVNFDGCNTAVTLKLETCIQSQLDCTTLQGTEDCKATNVSISVDKIVALYQQAAEQFRTLWNNGLASLGITIDTASQVSTGNSITFTLGVTYSGTITDTMASIKVEFSKSMGLRMQDMVSTEVSSGKRGVLSTSTIQITGNPNASSSGTSGLTFVLLPIVALISSIHYYF